VAGDACPIPDSIPRLNAGVAFIRNQKSEIWDELNTKKDMTDDLTKQIEAAIKEFQTPYTSAPGVCRLRTVCV
jgi:chaperonin cofactor prefoldin